MVIKRNPIPVVLILSIPVAILLLWNLINKGLPVSDTANFYNISYLTYLHFSESWEQGIHYIFHASGKPVLFSTLAAPFFVFFKINPAIPAAIFSLIIYAATVFSYYYLFSYRIDQVNSALLASTIALVPYIFSTHTLFTAETLWELWFILFLATLLRSENLENINYGFLSGILLSLSVLARPMESVIILFPFLALYFTYLHIYGDFDIRSLISNIALFFLIGAYCLLSSMNEWTAYNTIISINLFSLIYLNMILAGYMQNARNVQPHSFMLSNQRLAAFFLPLSLLTSLWITFYGKKIFYWAYENSFGPIAKTNDQANISKNIVTVFNDTSNTYGSFFIYSSLTIFAVAFLISITERKARILSLLVITIIASTILPMMSAYTITGTSDPRRIYLAMILLIALPLYYSGYIAQKSVTRKIAFTITLAAILFTAAFQAVLSITEASISSTLETGMEKYFGKLSYRSPNRVEPHEEEVIENIQSLNITKGNIAVFSLGVFSDHIYYDADSLQYTTQGINQSLSFSPMWAYTKYEPYDAVIKRLLNRNYQYVLLEDLPNPIKDPETRAKLQSHTFFVSEVLQRIRKNGENQLPGLELIDSFKIGNRKQYLFKIGNPDGTIITATSQLQEYSPKGLLIASEPGWHSKYDPEYPQIITIEYKTTSSVFNSIGFLPQDDNLLRSPKSLTIESSSNGTRWEEVSRINDLCSIRPDTEGWKTIHFGNNHQYKYIRFIIHENCGDKGLLTLRGIKFL